MCAECSFLSKLEKSRVSCAMRNVTFMMNELFMYKGKAFCVKLTLRNYCIT